MKFSHGIAVFPYYAAALGVLFVILSLRVIVARRTLEVGFGSGGHDDLGRRIRSQANFAEYVPIALILVALAEMKGASVFWVHGLCLSLVIGRVAHAVGLASPSTDLYGCVAGMTGSLTTIVAAATLIVFS